MNKLNKDELYTLEKYAEIREAFRAKVMAHKKNRRLAIGPNATLYFEDKLTMQYQVQEILRTERVFESAGIQEELEAYNPLIPDGSNWKATFMLEYAEEKERRIALGQLLDIEHKVWLKVAEHDPIVPIADEDLERTTEDKTSSVHFLRFELDQNMVTDLKNGAKLSAGISHDNYQHTLDVVPDNIKKSLMTDLA